jgi:phosphatidylglycerol---prolipoprotein diacylglyceryl transferase
MQPVLFRIPFVNWPIYGYGFMLLCAYIACTWLAIRLARHYGVPKEPIWDLGLWLFMTGLIGARLTYILVESPDKFQGFLHFFYVWDGGLVFYGSLFALVGYAFVYHFQFKKYGVSHWQMADIIAPGVALGLCLGRIGCLLNGCCYGNVACGSCPAVSFPVSSPPRTDLVQRGYQTPIGFLTEPGSTIVRAVEPASEVADLIKPGDEIEQIRHGEPIRSEHEMTAALAPSAERRGERWLDVVVNRHGVNVALPPVAPLTLGLHPTQIYESISAALLLFFLLSYFPYRRGDGSLMVLFLFGYSIHRFLNEMLRIDNEIMAFGMTFSQLISIGVFATALILAPIVWRRRPAPLAV